MISKHCVIWVTRCVIRSAASLCWLQYLPTARISILTMATKDAVAKGIHAGNIVKEVARICGGGGGGRPDMAQAGGKDASKLGEALEAAWGVIETQVK